MMNEYIGKVCPYCQTAFKEGDDIVVCSNCEMPHHKDCWIENKACTTFGCTGTISNADAQTQEAIDGVVFCTNCGAKMSGAQKFCTACGTPLPQKSDAPHYTVAAEPTPTQSVYTQQPSYTPPAQSAPQQPSYTPPAQSTPQQPSYTVLTPGYTPPQQSGYTPQQPNYTPSAQPTPQQPSYTPQQPSYTPQQPSYTPPYTQNTHTSQQGFSNGQQGNNQDVISFVQKNASYYVSEFAKLRTSTNKISWNWCAFLFGSAWMAYRKMLLPALIWVVVSAIAGQIHSLLSVVLCVVPGLFGNYLYMVQADSEIANTIGMEPMMKNATLSSKGGTSVGMMIGACVLGAILTGLFV